MLSDDIGMVFEISQYPNKAAIKGGNSMTVKNDVLNFKKMWAWLRAYPAHDQEYYMKHVAKLQVNWVNSCPLSNKNEEKDCDGCKMLWKSERGTLCTDTRSPLHKWKKSVINRPNDRSYYASQIAVLAMKFLRSQPSKAT